MVHLQVDLPPILKKALLDDYACIVEEGRLQPLPRQPTIDQLLQRYTGDVRNGGGGQRRRGFVWEMRGKRGFHDAGKVGPRLRAMSNKLA